jgi:5-(carboxyamino)imidazole ribonucleotide mutase
MIIEVKRMMTSKVSLIIGSESDKEIGDKAYKILQDFGIETEYEIISAHRNPEKLSNYINNCDADIFIAIAGLSAALPGYIASKTLKPVIGVPKEAKLGGLDSLLSIVQMPPGVPVACVGVDNSKNAVLLAIRILALNDGDLHRKLEEYKESHKG